MKPYASTMWAPDDAVWNGLVDVVDSRELRRNWRVIAELVRAGCRHDVLILNGAVPARWLYRDLIAAVLIRLMRVRCQVLISDATWRVGSATLERRLPLASRLVPMLARAAVRRLDGDRVHYAVLSTREREAFASTWGVGPQRVHFTPFSHTLHDPAERRPVPDAGYLFSGGNSLRDYDLLAEAFRGLPGRVSVAADWRPAVPVPGLTVTTVTPEHFTQLLRACTACVVPLRRDVRSAGQQSYLNAMLLGKPVIVTEAPGVRDYIDDGVTGVIVPPTAASLRRAMEHVLDARNAEQYRLMGEAARSSVQARFTPDHYRASLLSLAHTMCRRR